MFTEIGKVVFVVVVVALAYLGSDRGGDGHIESDVSTPPKRIDRR